MTKLGFVSDEVVRIDLEEGTWVGVRKELAFDQFREVFSHLDEKASEIENLKVALPLLELAIVNWSDPKVECTPGNIRKLNAMTIIELAKRIMPMYAPQKKSSTSSKPISKDVTTEKEPVESS